VNTHYDYGMFLTKKGKIAGAAHHYLDGWMIMRDANAHIEYSILLRTA